MCCNWPFILVHTALCKILSMERDLIAFLPDNFSNICYSRKWDENDREQIQAVSTSQYFEKIDTLKNRIEPCFQSVPHKKESCPHEE